MEVLFAAEDARSEATFTFIKENFCEVEDAVLSPPCMIRNLPWKIMIMQRSSKVDRGQKSLGFFLQCNGDSESSSWSCEANARLTIVSQTEGIVNFTRKIQHLFNSKENDWGFSHFIMWNDVIDPDKGFIKNNTVIFQAHINADAPLGIVLTNPRHADNVILKHEGNISDRNSPLQDLSCINPLTKVEESSENGRTDSDVNPDIGINVANSENLSNSDMRRQEDNIHPVCPPQQQAALASRNDDEYDIFGNYVASKLRTLGDPSLKSKMERQISQVILNILDEEHTFLTRQQTNASRYSFSDFSSGQSFNNDPLLVHPSHGSITTPLSHPTPSIQSPAGSSYLCLKDLIFSLIICSFFFFLSNFWFN